jgi:hypothetical protein
MRKLALIGVAFMLAGCATMDTSRTDAIRETLLVQLSAINATGIDPLQLDASKLMYASVGCGVLSSLGTVIDPTAPTLTDELAGWCELVLAAAAPAG